MPITIASKVSPEDYRTSGRYYSTTTKGDLTVANVANRLWGLALLVTKSGQYDAMSFNVNIAVAGAARLGIYINTGEGYPGALVLDAGTANTGTGGDKIITFSQNLGPGLYWLAMLADNTFTWQGSWSQNSFVRLGSTGAVAYVSGAVSVAQAYGVLPSTFPAGGTYEEGSIPHLSIRKA